MLTLKVIIPNLYIASRDLTFATGLFTQVHVKHKRALSTLCVETDKQAFFPAVLHLMGRLTNPSREISLMGEADNRIASRETCGTGRFGRTRY